MLSTSVYYYKPHRREDRVIRKRIREISEVRVRYGFWRIFILLRREGWKDNHKRVYRIYKEEGLNLRTKRPRRRKAAAQRMERPEISTINQCWSMDFVSDELGWGHRFRVLTLVDNFSRVSPALEVGSGMSGQKVAEVLTRLSLTIGVNAKVNFPSLGKVKFPT